MSNKLTKKQIQDKSVKAFGKERFKFKEMIDKRKGKFYCEDHSIEFPQSIFSHFKGILSCGKCIEIRDKQNRLNRLKKETKLKYETISLVRVNKRNSRRAFFSCSKENHGESIKSYYLSNTVHCKENFQIPCEKRQKENKKEPKNKKSDKELKKIIETFKTNLIYVRRNELDTSRVFLECPKHGLIQKSILISSLQKNNYYNYCNKCRIKKIPKNKLSNKEIQFKLDVNLNRYSPSKIYFHKRYVNSENESYGFFSCEEHGNINKPKLIQNSIRKNANSPCCKCNRTLRSKSKEEIQTESDKFHGHFTFFGYNKESYSYGYFVCKHHPERGVHNQVIASHIKGSNPCCSVKSKNEIEIIKILNKLKIKFILQYSYSDCKNVKSLLFDFYLPKHNLLIEYDGRQHFKHIKRFGSYTKFLTLQKCDKIKNKYVRKEEINFLRIPYTHNDKKEKMIKSVITKIDLGEYIYEIKLFEDLIKKSTQNN